MNFNVQLWDKLKLADVLANRNAGTFKVSLHYYMKLKITAVVQVISQDSSSLGWQHLLLVTVNLPELPECATIKSRSMKLATLQFIQNSLEVSSSHLFGIYQKSSNYNGSKNIPIFRFINSLTFKFQHMEVYITRTYTSKKNQTTPPCKIFPETPSIEE